MLGIGAIIASGKSDTNGKYFPLGVNFGGYHVRKIGQHINKTITTEALVFDRRTKTFTTFYNTCCGISGVPTFTPSQFDGPPGPLGNFDIQGLDYCSGQTIDLTGSSTFSSSNTGVATVSSAGAVHGVTAGFTDSNGSLNYPQQHTVDTCLNKNAYAPTPTTVVGPPDHLRVISDKQQVRSACPTTSRRLIQYQEVDVNNNPAGTVDSKEQFASKSTNTCNNGPVSTTETCSTDLNGVFTDAISVGCNSVGGSCGETLTKQQWLWCPPNAGTPVVIATPGDLIIHNDSISVGGNTAGFSAVWFLNHVKTRKRRSIKPATATSWTSHLAWINLVLGEMPLASVNNLAVKELVSRMAVAGFSPKTMHNYVQVVKMVVASAVNEQGEEIHSRKWNHEFIDLPQVTNQRKPTFTVEEVSKIVSTSEGQLRVLYALLGGAGLRIGEALALELKDISEGTITVRQGVWNGVLQTPKTSNGLRDVDVHSSLAALVKAHIGERASGFLFQSPNGKPLSPSNIRNRSLHPILKAMGRETCGFHAFRRFRVTHLRKNRVPEDLIRFWIGHADQTVTDGYSKVKEDVSFRILVCGKRGSWV
jgi:integrase